MVDSDEIRLRFDGDDADHLRNRYLWAPVIDLLLSDEKLTSPTTPGDLYWAIGDNLNTIRDIAKFDPETQTTSVVNHRVFASFGTLTSEANPAIDLIFGFTGRLLDEATQSQYNSARWYDARTGRWESEDPIGLGPDANLYRYVGNRVCDTRDPSGMMPPGAVIGPDFSVLESRTVATRPTPVQQATYRRLTSRERYLIAVFMQCAALPPDGEFSEADHRIYLDALRNAKLWDYNTIPTSSRPYLAKVALEYNGMIAITFGENVYLRPMLEDTRENLPTVAHEVMHYFQHRSEGTAFYIKYGLLLATRGYERNPYEIVAYAFEDTVRTVLRRYPGLYDAAPAELGGTVLRSFPGLRTSIPVTYLINLINGMRAIRP